MLTAPLPEALEHALAGLGGGDASRARANADLTGRYRSGAASAPVARSRDDVLAYAAARLPATYAATRIALGELAARAPWLQPTTHLDLGSGPGTAVWAARETWPTLAATTTTVTAIEAEPEMRTLARELGGFELVAGDLPAAIPANPHDLVTAAYLLGELGTAAFDATLDRAWDATGGALVIVEPGTPAGYERILAARNRLVAAGGTVIAPCPHDAACPLATIAGEWCHFAVRVARSHAHRTAKGAQLGYEDEKFSYVAVGRSPGDPADARVLRHPQIRSGHVLLELCTHEGRRLETVSRREGVRYRLARKLDWGSAFAGPGESR
jgi:ribosomal protein RSM22 (predicted rRNA methylase)